MTKSKRYILNISIILISSLIFIQFVFFQKPEPVNNEIVNTEELELVLDKKTGVMVGSQQAPLKIVIYTDFGCEACKQFHEELEAAEFKQNYIDTGKVQVWFKHVPPKQHKNAYEASAAAMAMSDKGLYWEMSTMLFKDANWSQLEPSELESKWIGMAKELHIGTNYFLEKYQFYLERNTVNEAKKEFRKLAFPGTPTIIVGNLKIVGAPSKEEFLEKVNSQLNKMTTERR